MELNEVLDIMVKGERRGAELMMHAHGVLAECKSGHRDVVTEYDRRIQELLMEQLREAIPGAKFFCEENMQRDDLNAEHLFIIDPIDGTMNFVRGFNHSCISVAYCRKGVLSAAAVYNPYVDEMFTAIKDGGAFLNGKKLSVYEGPLSDCVICCGTTPYDPQLSAQGFALMKKAFDNSLDIRRQGSAELDLCSAAAGRAGVYFELLISLWDYAAGMLIVQEAGGLVLNLKGEPIPFDGEKTSVLAGGKQAIEDFLKL